MDDAGPERLSWFDGGVLLVVVATIVLYAPSLSYDFIRDERVKLFDTGLEQFHFLQAFTDNTWQTIFKDRYYRPMFFMSLKLDLALWGRNPAGAHLFHLGYHLAVLVLLGRLLLRFGVSGAARTLALVFCALHPVLTEPVSWVGCRPDVLATLFGLASMVVLLDPGPPSVPRTLGAGLLMALALFSKELAMAFPVALVGALILTRASATQEDGARWPGPGHVALWLATSIPIYLFMRLRCPGLISGYPWGLPGSALEAFGGAMLNVKLAARYLTVLLTGISYGPASFNELATDRYLALKSAGLKGALHWEADRELALALVALAGLGALWIRWRRRMPETFALLVCLFTVFISLNLTTPLLRPAYNERNLYLPAVCAALLLGRGLERLFSGDGARRRAAVAAVILCFAAARVPWILERSAHYRDDTTFWIWASRENPRSAFAHALAARKLLAAGTADAAYPHLVAEWQLMRDRNLLAPLAWTAAAAARSAEAREWAAQAGPEVVAELARERDLEFCRGRALYLLGTAATH